METWKILAALGVVGVVGFVIWQNQNQESDAISKPTELDDPSFPRPNKNYAQSNSNFDDWRKAINNIEPVSKPPELEDPSFPRPKNFSPQPPRIRPNVEFAMFI